MSFNPHDSCRNRYHCLHVIIGKLKYREVEWPAKFQKLGSGRRWAMVTVKVMGSALGRWKFKPSIQSLSLIDLSWGKLFISFIFLIVLLYMFIVSYN
jgi:hypothetical protein